MRALRSALFAAGIAAGTQAQAATPDCARNLKLAIAMPAKVKITGADRVAAAAPGTVRVNPFSPPLASGLPAHCKVSGTINERRGVDGKRYAIDFEIALPDDWNGRLLFQGGGGLNGTINPPIGAAAAGDRPALARGFAVVSTDSGHKAGAGGFDASFTVDQQATLDFAHASVGTTTMVAKQVVAAHYGRAAHHSYIVGCSTGGREAMLASQRYPDLFDGIISGAPAMRTGFSNIGTSYITVMLNRAAAKDAAGKPVPLFSSADKKLILQGLLDDCDALDGLKDGIIAKVGGCHFKPARLACKGDKRGDCLSAAQVRGLEAAFLPPKDAAGAIIYPAFPWDTGIAAEGGFIPGVLTTGVQTPLGPPNAAVEIDLDQRVQASRADAMQMLTDTDVWTNLSTFLDRGGKIIWYHGVSDPWFSAWDTLDYFERAGKANGERWNDSARFYMVPGMGHCGGGNAFDQFDLLSPVVAWVEEKKAPAEVPARRNGPMPAEQPLCPWPSYPHYLGAGDEKLASNFECRS